MSDGNPLNKWKFLSLANKIIFLSLFIPIVIISSALFSSPGIIFSQDFPVLDTSTYSEDRLWLWMEETSSSGFENLARFTIIGIWYLLSFISLNSETASKFMIIIGFVLASFSFYGAFYYLLKNKFKENPLKFKISLILGSIFFAYNIWSFNRIAHYYLWIGYAILPIFITAVFLAFERTSRVKYVLIAALSWTFAASTPHMMIYYGIIFLLITTGHVFYSFRGKQVIRAVFKKIYAFTLVGIFFIILNLFWLIPYFLSYQYSSTLAGPTYLLNIEIIDIVSRTNDIINTLRLSSDWINFDQNVAPNNNPILYSIWSVLGYVFVSIFIISFIIWIRKAKYSIFFFILGILGIILALGTHFPVDYWGLLFNLPVISSYLWIFRDPDKWSFLVSISYSFMLVLFSLWVFRLFQKNRKKMYVVSVSFSILVIAMLIIHSYPIFSHTIYQKFNSIILPSDFENLNIYLSGINPSKVFYLPYSSSTPYWSANHTIGALYQFATDVPSIEISSPIQKKYYDYFSHLLYNNQTKTIGNFIYPFGTSYIIYHNDADTIGESQDMLEYLSNVEDINLIKSVGFFNIFKTSYEQSPVNIAKENIGIIGGLDNFEFLNKLDSFNTINSSLLFLDQFPKDNPSMINEFDLLVVPRSSINLFLSFIPHQYLLPLIEDTIHNEPSEYWSRVSTSDPLHGEFRSSIEGLDIENWDFDYEMGVIITEKDGAKIKSIFNTNQSNLYDIYIRYMENIRGGSIKIYLDDKFVKEISTAGKLNKFQWLPIETRNLTKGAHSLTIENVDGFNAINTFAVVPKPIIHDIHMQLKNNLNSQDILYLFDPNRDLDFSYGNSTKTNLFDLKNFTNTNNTIDSNGSISGEVHIPKDITKVRFEFLVDTIDNEILNPIERIVMNSSQFYDVFNENFEGISNIFTLSKSTNYSATLENSDSINNNTRLKISIDKEPDIDRESPWQIISTNFIPVDDSIEYKYGFDLESLNMVEFHPKIYYYDSDYNLIQDSILSESINGNQEKQYILDIFPPKNTAFVKLAYFFLPNGEFESHFTLDNIDLTENLSPIIIDTERSTELVSDLSNRLSVIDNSKNNDSTSVIMTDAFDVVGNKTFSYYIDLNTENITSINASLLLQSDQSVKDFMENNNKGIDSSNTELSQEEFNIDTNFDILKNGTYSILIRTSENATNTPEEVFIDGMRKTNEMIIDRKDNQNDLYLQSVYLSAGIHNIDIYYKNYTSIELVSIFSGNENKTEVDRKNLASIDKLFNSLEGNPQPPAQIDSFTKINPTKYSVNISNSTRPFDLIISESFDPLWIAKIETDNYTSQIESKPLYTVVNGFYVNKTGNFNMTIEYAPQKWFEIGAITSIIVLPIVFIITLYISKRFSK